MIRTLLIANRGEIARRIIRTARRMGIVTVAVYSDADAHAPHVREADRAVRIGGAAATDSYLNAEAIVAAARSSGANAIHPGYGFLSENADFAEACAAAGFVFVGPPPGAIRAMGDKARAKKTVAEAGVPVVPGHEGPEQSADALAEAAHRIGFPLLVKAVAGGGGRGMRRVFDAAHLHEAIDSARREAESAFADGRLLLERLVEAGRHIEVQVFADTHGACIHLGERDCSAQRRHQKIVEESPSPFVDDPLRQALGEAAVRAASAVGYVGAGTVEFIVDADRTFSFLEMNTRLQVEHPVTEMVTGLDLVEWQLRIAAGEPLPLAQQEVRFDGHAIEARLCAEDPADGFRPQTGTIVHFRPGAGEGIRIDSGVEEGSVVTPFYDSMVAKIIAHGRDRSEAIRRLRTALESSPLFGVTTNRAFLLDLLGSAAFAAGDVTTDAVDGWVETGNDIVAPRPPGRDDFAAAAAVLAVADGGGWFRSTGIATCPITLEAGGLRCETVVRFERGALARVTVDGEGSDITAVRHDGRQAIVTRRGTEHRLAALRDGRNLWLDLDGRTICFREPDPLAMRAADSDPSVITAPVSGQVRAVLAAEGQRVEAGATVAVIEAMKMETPLMARASGRISALSVTVGDQVRAGDVVARIAVDD